MRLKAIKKKIRAHIPRKKRHQLYESLQQQQNVEALTIELNNNKLLYQYYLRELLMTRWKALSQSVDNYRHHAQCKGKKNFADTLSSYQQQASVYMQSYVDLLNCLDTKYAGIHSLDKITDERLALYLLRIKVLERYQLDMSVVNCTLDEHNKKPLDMAQLEERAVKYRQEGELLIAQLPQKNTTNCLSRFSLFQCFKDNIEPGEGEEAAAGYTQVV